MNDFQFMLSAYVSLYKNNNMETKTTKESLINEIIRSSKFYDNPDELRIRDLKSVQFIHKMISAPKSKFISHFSHSRF